MRIKIFAVTLFLLTCSSPVYAQDQTQDKALHPADHQHGAEIWHMFTLEADYGGGKHGAVASWDMDGWIGTDENKLWLKAEGEREDGTTEQAEFWALYSRNIATFWDFQAGLRHDAQPDPTGSLVLGFEGLAPYFFETAAHLFVSEDGDTSARLRQENEFLLTQRLILEPYLEADFFAQDVPEQEVGAGLAKAEFGLQTRYEITRKFAPYLDLRYERKFGETASIAKKAGGGDDNFIAATGVRFMF